MTDQPQAWKQQQRRWPRWLAVVGGGFGVAAAAIVLALAVAPSAQFSALRKWLGLGMVSQPVLAWIDTGFEPPTSHGARTAEIARGQCPKCRVVSFPVSEHEGAGITPPIVAQAVRSAREAGAHVIYFGFGMLTTSLDLSREVALARKAGILMVAPAGVGLRNPFRPQPVHEIYPQALGGVLVVGTSILDPETHSVRPDPGSNFGPEVVAAKPMPGPAPESSLAAAEAAGRLGRHLSEVGRLTESEARGEIRSYWSQGLD